MFTPSRRCFCLCMSDPTRYAFYELVKPHQRTLTVTDKQPFRFIFVNGTIYFSEAYWEKLLFKAETDGNLETVFGCKYNNEHFNHADFLSFYLFFIQSIFS